MLAPSGRSARAQTDRQAALADLGEVLVVADDARAFRQQRQAAVGAVDMPLDDGDDAARDLRVHRVLEHGADIAIGRDHAEAIDRQGRAIFRQPSGLALVVGILEPPARLERRRLARRLERAEHIARAACWRSARRFRTARARSIGAGILELRRDHAALEAAAATAEAGRGRAAPAALHDWCRRRGRWRRRRRRWLELVEVVGDRRRRFCRRFLLLGCIILVAGRHAERARQEHRHRCSHSRSSS